MNILVFAHDSYLYGASQSLITVLKGIVKKEDRKVLVLLRSPGKIEGELRSANIDYRIVSFPWCVAVHKKTDSFIKRFDNIIDYYKKLKADLPQINKIATEFKPDVIYTNTSVVVAGYKVSRHLGIPHVWHVREFGNLDFNFTYYPSRNKIARLIAKSEKSIFASQALKNHWIVKNSLNNVVVYNGIIDKANDYITSFKKFPKELVRIGLLGTIQSGKGQHIAIKAFKELIQKKTNCELIFYGDPVNSDYFNDLKKLIRQLEIENKVFFKPFLDNKDLIYQNLDLLMSCSKMEGFGRTIVEAMGYGIPVIANSSGGAIEIIDDRTNGLLYDGSAKNLSELLIELLSDRNLYECLSLNGIGRSEKFLVKDYVDSIDSILKEASLEKKIK